jgi:peroxiredoxin
MGAASQKTVMVLALSVAMACGRSQTPGPSASASASPALPPLKVATKLLDPGDDAPLFALLAHTGMSASLERFLSKPVVVLFCPDLSAVNCESTLLALRDAWHALRPKVGMVLVVSKQERVLLREYAHANELPFLLLSDADATVSQGYGVGTAGTSGVQLFLISPQKKITARLPEPSPEAVRQWLSSL